MKRLIFIILCLAVTNLRAQDGALAELLRNVEDYNPALKAERELLTARVLEARSGNTLPDPMVNYDYLWGSPAELGKTGELNVVQGFDFPTLYARRGALARSLSGQYASAYAAMRAIVLLEAQTAWIDYQWLRRRDAILRRGAEEAARVAEAYARKVEAGESGILDKSKVDVELMNRRDAVRMNEIEMEAIAGRLDMLAGGHSMDISESAAILPLPILPGLEELRTRYLRDDPRLGELRQAALAAEDQVKVARSGAMPRFEVGYRRETALGETFNGVKMGMSIPLFENRHTVQKAHAEQQAAQVAVAGREAETAVELRRLHARAALLLESYNERAGLLSPERNAELLGKALEAGHMPLTDYFAELAAIREVELATADFERDYRRAVAELLMIDL